MIKVIVLSIVAIAYTNYNKKNPNIKINDLFMRKKFFNEGKFIEMKDNNIFCHDNKEKKYLLLCKNNSKIKTIFNKLDNLNNYQIPRKNLFNQIYISMRREIKLSDFEKSLNNSDKINIEKYLINNRFVLEIFINKVKSDKIIFINHGIFTHIRRHSIKVFIDNGYDICILWRNNNKWLNNDDFFYEPFDASFELNESIKLINKKFNYKKIFILNYSAGCSTCVKYSTNNNYVKPHNLKGYILVSCSPNALVNLENINRFISFNFKKNLFNLLNENGIKKYKINKKMTLNNIIGNIGCINKNMEINKENINKYFSSLEINDSNLKNINRPFFLINALDDNISRIKNYKNINKYLVNDVGFFISERGYHTHFYNNLNDIFLESLIMNFFDKT